MQSNNYVTEQLRAQKAALAQEVKCDTEDDLGAMTPNTIEGKGGALGGYGTKGPCRVGLVERIHAQLRRSTGEARRAERLQELAMLLDRNPEVARILDLVDEFRS